MKKILVLVFILGAVLPFLLPPASLVFAQETKPTFGPTCSPNPTNPAATCPATTAPLPVTAGSSATTFLILAGGFILTLLATGTYLAHNFSAPHQD